MCSRHIFACQFYAPRPHASSRTLHPQMLQVHTAQAYLSSLARPVIVSRHCVYITKRPLVFPVKAAQGSGSYDSDSDELLREFQRYADPNKLQNATKRLELTWGVQRKRKPALCDCCDGTGQQKCTWCRGTGAMMVGEERFCSLANGCKPCPICKSKGHVGCGHCKGTGYRAGWMEPGCPV